MNSIKEFSDITISVLSQKAIECAKAYNAYMVGDTDCEKLNDIHNLNQSLVD